MGNFWRREMRKIIIRCISFAALCFCVCQMAPANGYRTPEQAGIRNAVLFYYDPPRSHFVGCQSLVDAFLPYVGYVDSRCEITDTFFDGIVLIDLRPFYKNPSAATKERWTEYISKTFRVWSVSHEPVLSEPGHSSDHSVCIPYRNACVYKDRIAARDEELTVTLYARVEDPSDDTQDGYFGVAAFDRSNRQLDKGVAGLIYSTYLGIWYRYVDAEDFWEPKSIRFRLPRETEHFSIFLGAWHTPGICYDDVKLNGSLLIGGGFEEEASGWSAAHFPYPTLQFDSSAILAALDRAAMEVSRQLGYPDMRVKVILTIPWDRSSHLQANFGRVDRRECDLRNPSDATRAVKWFVRTCQREWKALAPEWLELAGFYWLSEEGKDLDKVIFPDIRDYVHELGYRLYGSPYPSYWRRKVSMGEEYVAFFDCLWLQPNVWPADLGGNKSKHFYSVVKRAYEMGWLSADSAWVRDNGIPLDELKEAEAVAESLNMGINMEWVEGQESMQGYGRILDYMNTDRSLSHDFSEASHLFYDDGGFGWYCCRSDSPVFRDQYDGVYRFVRRSGGR
jgi:hypothetical protein